METIANHDFSSGFSLDTNKLQNKAQQEDKSEDNDHLKLTPEKYEQIKLKIETNMPFIEKSLQETPVNVKGVYISVIVSILFIVLASFINKIQDVSNMAAVVQGIFESTHWDEKKDFLFPDIKSIEDVKDYVRRKAIPSIDSDMGDYNYFIGLRMTLKLSGLKNNTDPNTNKNITRVRRDPVIYPDGQDGFDDPDKRVFWSYKKGSFDTRGNTIYYLPNHSEIPLLNIWREAESVWLDSDNFCSLTIEYLFQNANTQTTLYYYQTFIHNGGGKVTSFADVIGSFVEKFEEFSNESLQILIIFIIYTLGFTLQVFKLTQNLWRTCKYLLTKRKLDLVWHEYIEIFSVILTLVSIVLFGVSVFASIGRFKLPISSENQFDELVQYSWDFRLLIQITALAALLIALKVIVVLRYKFPSFGVLFDTILTSKSTIMNFIWITVFLLIGFVFWAFLAFGRASSSFQGVLITFQTLFDMAMGQLSIKDDMLIANQYMSTFFIIFYMTVFFFVLTNTFLAIIMITYEQLKIQGELILEAQSDILAEQSNEWFQALMNLIFFRVVSVENDAINYEALQEVNRDNLTEIEKQDLDEKLKMYETLIIASSKIDIIRIFKTNFARLSSLNKPTLLTHEQNISKIRTTVEKILEKRELKKKENMMKQNLVDYNFNLILQMFIYVVFIAIFIAMILLRLRITDSYKIYDLNSKIFFESEYGDSLTLSQAVTKDAIFEYFREVFAPNVQGSDLMKQNFFFSKVRARISLEIYKTEENHNKFSASVISEKISAYDVKLLESSFRGNFTKVFYDYYPPGSKQTFNKNGGFVIYLGNDTNIVSLFKILQSDDVLGFIGSSLAVEWVTYNPNMNLFAYSYILIEHQLGGNLFKTFYCQPINLDFFQEKIPIVGILEIVYLLFTIYYTIIEAKEWIVVWKEIVKEEEEKQKGSKALKRVLVRLKGNQRKEKGCQDIIRKALNGLKHFLKMSISFGINIMKTFKLYFKRDSFNLIDLASIILSILNLSQIFQLSINSFVNDFNIDNISNYEYIDEFSDINNTLTLYKTIVSFNCLIIFIRLLQFYKFSNKLSLLTDILDSATLDLIFYMLMFSIVLFAYTLMGYLLLGHTLTYFSSLPQSLISCYLMLIGEYTSSDIYKADSVFGTLFLASFVIFFMLIFLNMFIAIITSHFDIVVESEDHEDDDMGFITKIITVIMAKKDKKKFLNNANQDYDINLLSHSEKTKIELKELEVFKLDNAVIDNVNPIFWLKIAENTLKEKSDKRLTLFDLRSMTFNQEKCSKITSEAMFSEMPYLNIEQWKQSSISEKIKLWRAGTKLSREYALRSTEKAYFVGSEIPSKSHLCKTMEKLWEATTREEKLELWMGKEHFNNTERISIWNSIEFKNETFNIPLGQSFFEYWTELKMREKLVLARDFVRSMKNVIDKVKLSSNPIENLLSISKDIKDFKFVLWLGLVSNPFWLESLYINQHDTLQAEVISYLSLALYEGKIFSLEGLDSGLEDLVDGMIFNAVEANSLSMSEMCKISKIRNDLLTNKSDIEALKDYYDYAREEINKLRKKKIELEEEYRKYSKK